MNEEYISVYREQRTDIVERSKIRIVLLLQPHLDQTHKNGENVDVKMLIFGARELRVVLHKSTEQNRTEIAFRQLHRLEP